MSLKDVRTRFVLDRIKGTSWKHRSYIEHLQIIEDTIIAGGPRSYIESMAFCYYRDKYPIEAECIQKEIRQGIYTSPSEFRRLLHEHRLKVQAEELRLLRERRRRLAEERKQMQEERKLWLSLGGKP
ncbi:MAG: hypothetical protein IMX00_07710 [Limnochordales bacterium]|nr:hypothetical protein [Limnochordales bacterium]